MLHNQIVTGKYGTATDKDSEPKPNMNRPRCMIVYTFKETPRANTNCPKTTQLERKITNLRVPNLSMTTPLTRGKKMFGREYML